MRLIVDGICDESPQCRWIRLKILCFGIVQCSFQIFLLFPYDRIDKTEIAYRYSPNSRLVDHLQVIVAVSFEYIRCLSLRRYLLKVLLELFFGIWSCITVVFRFGFAVINFFLQSESIVFDKFPFFATIFTSIWFIRLKTTAAFSSAISTIVIHTALERTSSSTTSAIVCWYVAIIFLGLFLFPEGFTVEVDGFWTLFVAQFQRSSR